MTSPPPAPAPAAAAVEIYADGACRGNPGPGGWGVWLRSGAHEKELWGGARDTTNNRMELTAVIEALASLKRRCRVTIHTDSQYVHWRWVKGHAGDVGNERADALANRGVDEVTGARPGK